MRCVSEGYAENGIHTVVLAGGLGCVSSLLFTSFFCSVSGHRRTDVQVAFLWIVFVDVALRLTGLRDTSTLCSCAATYLD